MNKKKEININALPGTTRINKTGSWRTFKPKIVPDKCISCGMCAKICPEGAITISKNGKIKINYDYCKGCGLCAAHCPKNSIIMIRDEK